VRFESDEQDFEKFLNQLWTVGGHGSRGSGEIRLMTARPPYSPVELPCVQPSCPSWIPLPPPCVGCCRTILYPSSCGSQNGTCGGASCSPTSGTMTMIHESPFADGPFVTWGPVTMPGWLLTKNLRFVYRVAVLKWATASHVAVGAYFFDIFGAGGWRSGTGGEVFVSGPVSASGFNFSAGASASIAGTLEDPIGHCYPCGSNQIDCRMSFDVSGVALVVDYDC
jgi:hypothetical protein